MYSRYPNYRFSGGMRLPENYSGNAFKPSEEESEEKILDAEENNPSSDSTAAADSINGQTELKDSAEVFKPSDKKFRLPGFNLNIGRIFSRGFGIEELLIIGIILLLAKNDTDDDIIFLLALLLFIG